jgi:hypothetical protein
MRGEGLEREESEVAIMTAKPDKEGGVNPVPMAAIYSY